MGTDREPPARLPAFAGEPLPAPGPGRLPALRLLPARLPQPRLPRRHRAVRLQARGHRPPVQPLRQPFRRGHRAWLRRSVCPLTPMRPCRRGRLLGMACMCVYACTCVRVCALHTGVWGMLSLGSVHLALCDLGPQWSWSPLPSSLRGKVGGSGLGAGPPGGVREPCSLGVAGPG